MLNPDFKCYSLALLEDGMIIHSSRGSGLRPLCDAEKIFGQVRTDFTR